MQGVVGYFESRHVAELVISEGAGRRGRALVTLAATSPHVMNGTIIVELAGGEWAALGTEGPQGRRLAVTRMNISPGGTNVAMIADCELSGVGLIWPAGIGFAARRGTLEAMRAQGLVVRPDDYLARATWPMPAAWAYTPSGGFNPPGRVVWQVREQLLVSRIDAAEIPAPSPDEIAVAIAYAGGGVASGLLLPFAGESSSRTEVFGALRMLASAASLSAGDKVSHAQFGAVVIAAINGTTANLRATEP